MELCDLHAHSFYSDGTDSPKAIVDKAVALGLKAVALTDHNDIRGLEEFLEAGKGKAIELVTGVELSTDYEGRELHILALFIDRDKFPIVREMTADILARKEDSNKRLIENLFRDGYEITYDEVKAECKGLPNRAVIAGLLVDKGYASDIPNAFATLLNKKSKYYTEPKRITAFDAIRFIKSIGAVAVLAHPFVDFDEESELAELYEFLNRAKECGLDGIETNYSTYSPSSTYHSIKICEELGLKKSGGSDYHGARKLHIQLGRGTGTLEVPYEFVTELKKK